MESQSIHHLTMQEKTLIGDICAIQQAADAVKNLQPDVAQRIRNVLFHRIELLALELELTPGNNFGKGA
jgi:hypothetical protein